ncbi:MAG: biopolymer transporter ExbD [bacterium]
MAFPPSRVRNPGSHIKKQSKSSSSLKKDVPLHLTSMIDMFTILVVFLLKSFSIDGDIMSISPDLKLPESTEIRKPERSVILAVNKQIITVEGKPIISYGDVILQKQILIKPLKDELDKLANMNKLIAEKNKSVKFSGDIIIQGDKNIPFCILEKVMYTCGQSEYINMNLAVYSKK